MRLLVAVFLLAGTALAADDARIASLSTAAEKDLSQIALAKLALQKSEDPSLRELATRTLSKRTHDYDTLEHTALREGLPFPSEPAGNQKLLYRDLSRLSGAEFDRAYREEVRLAE